MHRVRAFLVFLALVVLLAGLLPATLGAQTPTPATSRRVVQVTYRSEAAVQSLASRLDVWEVHPDSGTLVALVSPEEEAQLREEGYSVEVLRVIDEGIQAPLDARFYYYDDYYTNPNGLYMVDFLQSTGSNFPGIAELFDAGMAWQGLHGGYARNIWMLRISNEDPAFGPIIDKPAFVLHANIHAREVATPELAIRYIKYLTMGYNGQGGYGVDPDVTWLVDWNAIYVLVTANPDGRVVDEQNTSAYWRKNMDNDDGCTSSYGVDLNRNHNFLWGCCGGSSGNPCSETYRGPSRSSEPETFAFQNFITVNNILRDQNGPNGPDEFPPAAPPTTTGILLSLHSYADEILWPWGFAPFTSPNDPELTTIGRKLAYYSGYVPTGAIGYDVDGDTHDWSYGQLGIASYTIEVGPNYGTCADFFPPYGCIDGIDGMPRNFWSEMRPVLLYMHKVARSPYMTSYGPDADTLAVTDPVQQGQPAALSAHIQDHRYGGDPIGTIAAAEYFIDQPGADGTGTPMAPQDGSWGGSSETAVATVNTGGLSIGRHYILVHGRKTGGEWGPFTAVFMTVESGACEPVQIAQVFTQTSGVVVTFSASLTGTAPYTYSWDFGAYGTADTPTATVNFGITGVYPYTLTVLNCWGTAQDSWAGLVSVSGCDPVREAAFSWTPGSPVTGEIITFTGSAANVLPLTFDWDWGDGSTGSGASATHSYALLGDYVVTMSATNGCDVQAVTHTVTVCGPAADPEFSWLPANPVVGEAITLTGSASGSPPFAFAWDLGDGSTGSGATLTHTYSLQGDYLVAMTASNSCGQAAITHTIPVCGPVQNAALSWTPPNPAANEWVAFHASADGTTPITFAWDFGDGGRGSGANASHRYSSNGSYTVVLTATNGCGQDVVSGIIVVGPCTPVSEADFSYAPPVPLAGDSVLFTASADGTAPHTFSWDLGDGSSASGNPATHTYTATGVYTVTLTVSNCAGLGSVTIEHALSVVQGYRVYLPIVFK